MGVGQPTTPPSLHRPAPPAPDVIRGGIKGRLAPARVALGPDLRREERDKELAFVGVAWCIVDARYGLLCSVG